MRIATPSCVLSLMMARGYFLDNITKDWLGFLSLLRRVSHDTSYVLVHGYYSCDIGLMQLVMVHVNDKQKIEIKCMSLD
jgi:hypothetical protein